MQPMDEQQFSEQYWFDNLKRVTVVNPTDKDYIFQSTIEVGVDVTTGKMRVETRHFRVPAGGSETFPGPIAGQYLSQLSRILAQDQDKFQHYIDPLFRAQLYDSLIAEVTDLIQTYTPFPEYLEKAAEVKAEPEPEFSDATEVKARLKPAATKG